MRQGVDQPGESVEETTFRQLNVDAVHSGHRGLRSEFWEESGQVRGGATGQVRNLFGAVALDQSAQDVEGWSKGERVVGLETPALEDADAACFGQRPRFAHEPRFADARVP